MFQQIHYVFRRIDRTDRRRYVWLVLLSVISPVIDVYSISMLLPILNEMVEKESEGTLPGVLFIGFLLLFKTGFDILLTYLGNGFAIDSERKLSAAMFDLLQKEDLAAHKSKTQSIAFTVVRRDAFRVIDGMMSAKNLFIYFLTMVGYGIVIVLSVKWIGAACFAGVAVLMTIIYLLNRVRVEKFSEKVREMNIRASEMVFSSFGAYKEIRVDSNRDSLLHQFEGQTKALGEENKRFALFSELISTATQDLLQAAVFFLLAFALLLKVDITGNLSSIIVFVTVLVKMLPLSSNIIHMLIRIRSTHADFLHFKENAERYDAILAREEARKGMRVRKPSFEKGITVRGLTFAYEDSDSPIFEDADIDIPKGKTIAITGNSGTGKTTFLDLLIGLSKPQKGAIFYDDVDIVAGRDADGECIVDIGDLVSYIPQEIYLNGYTVRDNVSFMTPQDKVDENRIIECLKCAAIYDDVMRMPNGMDTMIGNGGTKLSGGQRQRVALARALYKDFEILVLDEATASLDMETEAAIIESIREMKAGKTVLMVTHHNSLAEACEIIYKMENRRFVRVEKSGK